jgi:tetratricopeptide (TPR) repeat protein
MMRLFFALGLLGMIASRSLAADAPNLQAAALSCGAFMTCRSAPKKMSLAHLDFSRHQSKVPALKTGINGFHARPAAENARLCEKAIRESKGTARDRATALVILGHTYAAMPEHYDFRQAPDATIMVRTWRKAASVDPTLADPLIAMAHLYSSAGQGEKALGLLADAERIEPENWRVHTRRALAFRNMHVAAAMLPPAEKAMELAPGQFEVRRDYATALFHNRRFAEAVTQYEIAAELFDRVLNRQMDAYPEENIWSALADAYAAAGRPGKAAHAMTTLLDSTPQGARSHFDFERRARYFELEGLHQQAADDLAEAVKRAPKDFAEQYNVRRSILLTKTSSRQSAVSDLRAALQQGDVRPTIKVQLFLRNQGYNDVGINGKYDAATKRALDDCFERPSCIQVIGQAI